MTAPAAYHGHSPDHSFLLDVDEHGTHTLRTRTFAGDWSAPVVLEPLSEPPC